MTTIRNSLHYMLRRWSGRGIDQYTSNQPKVVVIQKSDESLWNCLRSKPCVCTLLSFFMLELLCIVAIGLKIWLFGNFPWCLEVVPTTASSVGKYYYNINVQVKNSHKIAMNGKCHFNRWLFRHASSTSFDDGWRPEPPQFSSSFSPR